MAEAPLHLRRAAPGDLDAIVALCARSLGWAAGEPHRELFEWKHQENPFGASPMWVAHDDAGALTGVRALMRWRFLVDGAPVVAVRAVDTATDPSHQGRGIFKALTMRAVQDLALEGVELVFNTPNDQSRPGYLSMGWKVVGRVPIAARLSGIGALGRMLTARVPAEKWSRPSDAGVAVGEIDDRTLQSLIDGGIAGAGLTTDRTPAHLRWRYGFAPLHYRAITIGGDPAEGLAIVRLRGRGSALEATVCEVLAPDAPARRRVLREVRRGSGADYLVVAGAHLSDGVVPMPEQGPLLTWRPITRTVGLPHRAWHLQLGDVELF